MRELNYFTTPFGDVRAYTRPGTCDWNTLFSCLVDDEYHVYEEASGWIVEPIGLDIGGYIGGATLAMLRAGYEHVTVIEPFSENVNMIELNLEINGWSDRATVIHGATADGPGQLVKIHFGNEPVHQFIGNSYPSISDNYEEVRGVTFAELLGTRDEINLMKLDAEGGEWALLKGARHEELAKVRRIEAELHGGQGDLIWRFLDGLPEDMFVLAEHTTKDQSPDLGLVTVSLVRS